MQRRSFVMAGVSWPALVGSAFAHHGWSSFDQDTPLFLAGKVAKAAWRNPHVELELDLPEGLALPPDLAKRALPRQSAEVDGPGLLAKARLPRRRDRRWHIELAPLTRMQAWGIPGIPEGSEVQVVGFTFTGEQGEAVLRAEYLFMDGKAYGLRSSPA